MGKVMEAQARGIHGNPRRLKEVQGSQRRLRDNRESLEGTGKLRKAHGNTNEAEKAQERLRKPREAYVGRGRPREPREDYGSDPIGVHRNAEGGPGKPGVPHFPAPRSASLGILVLPRASQSLPGSPRIRASLRFTTPLRLLGPRLAWAFLGVPELP